MSSEITERMNQHYDNSMLSGSTAEIDKIGFYNYGYWRGVRDSLEVAQINLIETLVSFLSKRGGNVLDVACGKGASTKFLTKYFNPKNIIGINCSEIQLQICRMMAAECNFMLMDATKLSLDDSSFDNLLCIEAAFHFMTRNDFLKEAYRVLRPGGKIAMSDIVVHDRSLLPRNIPLGIMPAENCLPHLDAYRAQLREAGFRYVRVEDSTDVSVTAFQRYRDKRAEMQFDLTKDYESLHYAYDSQSRNGWTWCMVYAIK